MLRFLFLSVFSGTIGFWSSPYLVRLFLRDKMLKWYIVVFILSLIDLLTIFLLSPFGFAVPTYIVVLNPILSFLLTAFIFWSGMLFLVHGVDRKYHLRILAGVIGIIAVRRILFAYVGEKNMTLAILTLLISLFTFVIGYIGIKMLRVEV